MAFAGIDLHRHLEGSVRFGTLMELAREVGIELPARELRRRTSMKGEKPGVLRFLSKFDLYRGLYPSRDWIERIAREAAEDAARDGVTYLELRFSPAHFARRMNASGEDVAAWIARGARRAGIDVRFIATFGRDFSLRENRPTARAVEGTRVFSGLDLAGNEARSARPFVRLFRRSGLPVTIHAGETGGPRNVSEAIDLFGARRIGHGVRILENPRLMEQARRLNVAFETCLTSELQTGAARSLRAHPVRRMQRAGLRVTLNTDDPSICNATLSGEYRLARKANIDVKSCVAVALDAAFLSASARRRLRRRIQNSWGPLHNPQSRGKL